MKGEKIVRGDNIKGLGLPGSSSKPTVSLMLLPLIRAKLSPARKPIIDSGCFAASSSRLFTLSSLQMNTPGTRFLGIADSTSSKTLSTLKPVGYGESLQSSGTSIAPSTPSSRNASPTSPTCGESAITAEYLYKAIRYPTVKDFMSLGDKAEIFKIIPISWYDRPSSVISFCSLFIEDLP